MTKFIYTFPENIYSRLSIRWTRSLTTNATTKCYLYQLGEERSNVANRMHWQGKAVKSLLMQQDTLKSQRSSFHCYSGNCELDGQIGQWMKWDQNPKTLAEITDAIKKEEWKMLETRLCKRITFGTAGLRGPMRAGFDAMNDLIVIQAAQGLCEYLKQQYPDEAMWSERGIVIGYDARHNSKRFAELSAVVFLKNKFRVYLLERFVATPLVPFSISRLCCLAGVMVTASHNPKQDNGYKVYWSNAAQIIPPHDVNIHRSILDNLKPADDAWDASVLKDNELLSDPYEEIMSAYLDSLKLGLTSTLLETNAKCSTSFTYTAMHGVGYPYIKLAFDKISLKPVIPVCEQVEPDPEFPTTPLPNPEEGKTSMDLSIKRATAKKSPIILANDPDADRLAVAEVGDNKQYKLFNGNELGALLGWWALESYKIREKNPDLANCCMVASTVSSKILRSMAEVEGFTFHETLTGFKWIGNKALDEQNAGKQVLFGFEEAIGYMVSTNVPDKDGVSAASHVATMACYLQSEKCQTLQQKLREIYETYGYHVTIGSYFICKKQAIIEKIFNRLRTFKDGQKDTYPTSILNGEFEVEHVRDLTTGYDSSTNDKKAKLPVSASTQMITFTFKNGLVVTLRTSGTEPKIKYYAEMCGKPEDKEWDKLSETLKRMVEAIVNEFLEPEKNELQAKAED